MHPIGCVVLGSVGAIAGLGAAFSYASSAKLHSSRATIYECETKELIRAYGGVRPDLTPDQRHLVVETASNVVTESNAVLLDTSKSILSFVGAVVAISYAAGGAISWFSDRK